MQKLAEDSGTVAVVPEEMIEAAVAAVDNLIIHTLKAKEPGKYAEAARLCNIGQSLMRTKAKRVGDFAALDIGNMNDNQMDGVGVIRGGYADEREVQRNRDLTFGPVAQVTAEAQRATVAAQEATELQNLASLRANPPAGMNTDAIDARIRTLTEHMEVRNNANRSEMVHADVPRGPAPGEEGAQADVAQGVRPDADGREGHAEAPFEERVAQALAAMG